MPHVVLVCGHARRTELEAPDGITLHEIMVRENPETGNWPAPVICLYGGKPVLRAEWATTRLEGDAVAVFFELPMGGGGGGGGGSNPVQMVLQVAVIALSVVASTMIPGAGIFAAGGALAGWGQMVGGLVGAGIMMGGSMLIGAICGNNMPSMPSGQLSAANAEQASPTYSLNGSGNQIRLYQPEPEQFGKLRVVPDKVAQEWAEYLNNDMYLYQVFGLGRGLYQQHSMSFGDTVFWRDGHLIESAYTPLSGGESRTTPINAALAAENSGGDWTGPYMATPNGAASSRLDIRISFPDGLCTYEWREGGYTTDEQGNQVWTPGGWVPRLHTASCAFEYREAGTEEWKPLSQASYTLSTEKSTSYTISGTAPFFGSFEVRGKNTGTALGPVGGHGTINPRQRLVWSAVLIRVPDVQVEIVEPGGAVTLFPDNVETSLSVGNQELLAPNAGGDWIGPFPSNSPGTRTAQIHLDMTLPRGLGIYDKKGRLQSYSVSYEAQYRAIDDYGASIGPWAVLTSGSITLATLTAQRRTLICNVAEGRYEVKMRRTSNADQDGRGVSTLMWEAMRVLLPGTLTYPQTVVAVKTRATNVLSQNAAGSFAVVQTRKLPVWNAATQSWSDPVPTRSFAAAVAWICKAPYGGRLHDRNIELDGLWALDAVLQKNGWNFDAWIDGAYSVWQLLAEICQSFLVIPRVSGSVVSFVMDQANRPVRHTFTPYDIVRGSFMPIWNTYDDASPDDVVVSYLDEEAGYAQRDVRAVLPDSESRKPSQRTYLGIANRKQAHAVGVAYAARNRHRRLGYEFQTEGIGRLLNIGDVVAITHPRLRGSCSGAVADWNEETLTIRLQGEVRLKSGATDRYLSLTRPDGSPWGPVRLATIGGNTARMDSVDYGRLLMQGQENPFAWLTSGVSSLPTTWTLQEGREFSRRVIITGIAPQDLYHYKITCINDSPDVDGYDIPVPPWEYRSNLPSVDSLDAPKSLRVRIGGSEGAPVLLASWLPVAGAAGYEVETSVDGESWDRAGRVTVSAAECPTAAGDAWLRVSAIRDELQSPWAQWSGNTAVTIPDAPVVELSGPYLGGALSLSWDAVAGDPSYIVRIYPDVAQEPVRQAPLSGTSWTYTPVLGVDDGGPWRTLRAEVVAVNEVGESPPGVVSADDPAPDTVFDIDGVTGENSVTLEHASVEGEYTGFVLIRGLAADFDASGIAESRIVDALPYTWTGLESGTTYYFRIAAKDAFFDVSGDFASLNYSDVLVVTPGTEQTPGVAR